MKKSLNKYEVPLSIVLFFLIVFLLSKQINFVYVALVIGVLSMLSDWITDKLTFVWQKIMKAFGFVNSRVLLSLIFFVFLTPIAFLYRLFKGDILGLKKNDTSYYKTRDHKYESKDLVNPW